MKEYKDFASHATPSLMENLEQWHQEDRYQQIIDAIEKLPSDEQTPELISQLARAYNNLAEPGDRPLFEKAVQLLESVEEDFPYDHNWNFRMGYALYFLDRELKARHYFEKALEYRPGDEDTQEFIKHCNKRLALPFEEGSGVGVGENSEPDRKCSVDGKHGGADGETGDGADETGAFTGFVLLPQPRWNSEQFKADIMADWGIECIEEEGDKAVETRVLEEPGRGEDGSILIFSVGNMRVVVALMEAPVPGGEAEANAANNYMWPEAVEIVKTHQAQLIVAVLGPEAPIRERGLLFVKVMSVCCKQDSVLGIYTSGNVFQPEFYLEASEMMKKGGLPVLNWIYFGLYQTKEGWNTYTYGMKTFGKNEMEVLDVKANPQDVRDFLFDMVYYVLEADVTLRDGETIGFSEEQKLPITLSKGVGLDGYTLKIGYPEE